MVRKKWIGNRVWNEGDRVIINGYPCGLSRSQFRHVIGLDGIVSYIFEDTEVVNVEFYDPIKECNDRWNFYAKDLLAPDEYIHSMSGSEEYEDIMIAQEAMEGK